MLYEPRKKGKGRPLTWGYKQDPDDPEMELPIPEHLEMLEKAYEYLKVSSYREVAIWLSGATGSYLSYKNLFRKHKKWLAARRKRK